MKTEASWLYFTPDGIFLCVCEVSVPNAFNYFLSILQIEDSLFLVVRVICVRRRTSEIKKRINEGNKSLRNLPFRVSLTGVCVFFWSFLHICVHTHTHSVSSALSSPSVSWRTSCWEFIISLSSCPEFNSRLDIGLCRFLQHSLSHSNSKATLHPLPVTPVLIHWPCDGFQLRAALYFLTSQKHSCYSNVLFLPNIYWEATVSWTRN